MGVVDDRRSVEVFSVQARHALAQLGSGLGCSRAQAAAAGDHAVDEVGLLVALAHDHVQSVGAQAQAVDRLLVGRAQQRLPVDFEDPHADTQAAVASHGAAAVDFRYEDALVVGVERISALALQSALDMHAEALALVLDYRHHLQSIGHQLCIRNHRD